MLLAKFWIIRNQMNIVFMSSSSKDRKKIQQHNHKERNRCNYFNRDNDNFKCLVSLLKVWKYFFLNLFTERKLTQLWSFWGWHCNPYQSVQNWFTNPWQFNISYIFNIMKIVIYDNQTYHSHISMRSALVQINSGNFKIN